MNCRKAEQLIPLYVESDLDFAEMQFVAEHLQNCANCCELAAEFQASQNLLRTATAPEFDDALFADMRCSVQQVLDAQGSRFSFAEFLARFNGWKFALATATALILLASAVVIKMQSASENKIRIVKNESAVIENENVERKKTDEKGPAPITIKNIIRSRKNFGVVKTERDIPKQPSPEKAPVVPEIAKNEIPDARLIPSIGDQSAIADSNTEKKSAEPEMLRMEIQTADPNIKIIWLTPKDSVPGTAGDNR